MTKAYTLDYLINIFHEHALKYEEQERERIENFRRDYPGEKVPYCSDDGFILPAALRFMCEEIKKIREPPKDIYENNS